MQLRRYMQSLDIMFVYTVIFNFVFNASKRYIENEMFA